MYPLEYFGSLSLFSVEFFTNMKMSPILDAYGHWSVRVLLKTNVCHGKDSNIQHSVCGANVQLPWLIFILNNIDKCRSKTFVYISIGAKPVLGPNCMIPYIKKGV